MPLVPAAAPLPGLPAESSPSAVPAAGRTREGRRSERTAGRSSGGSSPLVHSGCDLCTNHRRRPTREPPAPHRHECPVHLTSGPGEGAGQGGGALWSNVQSTLIPPFLSLPLFLPPFLPPSIDPSHYTPSPCNHKRQYKTWGCCRTDWS